MSVIVKAIDESFAPPSVTVNAHGFQDISDDINSVINRIDPPNYLSFDGYGLDLINENKKFYSEGDYIGLFSYNDNVGVEIQTLGQPFPIKREIVVEFYDNSCDSFEVYTRDQNTELKHYDTVLASNGIAKFKLEIETYLVELRYFTTSAPNYSIKIASISLGGVRYFDKFKNCELLEEINVLSDDLPMNKLNIDVVTDDFSLVEDSAITVFSNNVNYGTFYISDIERVSQNVYSLTCYNSVKQLEDFQYEDWTMSCDMSPLVSQLSSLTEIKINSDEELDRYGLLGHIPINTARYALCAACFVCGLLVDGSRGAEIKLKKIPNQITSIIENDRIIGDATLTKSKVITAAEYHYVPRGFSYETKQIEIKNEANARIKHLYEKPSEYMETDSEITVYSQSDNYIDFVSPQENISLTVFELTYPSAATTIVNLLATEKNKPNVVKFDSFGLLGVYDGRIIEKTGDIAMYIQSRGSVKAKIILNGERVGDLVQITTAWDGVITGIITSMNIFFGFRDIAEIEVLEWPIG